MLERCKLPFQAVRTTAADRGLHSRVSPLYIGFCTMLCILYSIQSDSERKEDIYLITLEAGNHSKASENCV